MPLATAQPIPAQTLPPLRRRRRWLRVSGLLFLALLLVVGFAIAFRTTELVWKYHQGQISLADLDGTTPTTSTIATIAERRQRAETGDDPFLGNPDAPIVIVEFADFNCPYCQQSALVMRQVAAKFPHDVKIIFRDFPILDNITSPLTAMAGECAAEQGQGMFWAFHDLLYVNQSNISTEKLTTLAAAAGLNTGIWQSCLASQRYQTEVRDDLQAGIDLGVTGTPTFFVNGEPVAGHQPFESWVKAITALRAKLAQS